MLPESKELKKLFRNHHPVPTIREIAKYIGPGLLVTVGFIDPGNWASNLAAGSQFGYTLLWVVTFSTIILVLLQHNAAHLGIATGLCMSEAATVFYRPVVSIFIITTAVAAATSTALAEILGASIALNMLFRIPIKIGTLMVLVVVGVLVFSNSYKKLERIIISFVSLIGLAFIYELTLIHVSWGEAIRSSFVPSIPNGSILIVMSVLGAVVMPHNLFLHSEIIQSRKWNLEDDKVIKRQLRYEFLDTLFSMVVGWGINSAMIIIAAAAFFASHNNVNSLIQAPGMLAPLLGRSASVIFAFALLCSGISSTITAGLAGGSIFSGYFKEPYDIRDNHTRLGVGLIFGLATIIIMFIQDTFKGLIMSQVVLSIQLPLTIFLLISLTSSKKVMGSHANSPVMKIVLWMIGILVTILNVMLVVSR